ncbi:hypothetical protein [Mahella australiensis]|uniref:Uncharacterized protein n=1 Tax=Mahella australiensis (strain DSM 15567 / CIP 107919 / 50-1 BON) TaxID=697281 RepID=F3ZZX4_MAHA5|nr:hypothetical protein [Mahella australiensis]AEE95792.1 hypothetical protein Mahau_0589 [Mahella australiensis 50-1 BON]
MPNNPYKEIARLIDDRSRKGITAATSVISAELGTITSSGLKLDRFKYEIQDYLVAEYLIFPTTFMTEAAGADSHTHMIETPEQMQPINEGDRVMAVPVNGGTDFVVIAKVV